MSFEEHLIENAISAIQDKEDYETARSYFKDTHVNKEMAKDLNISLDIVFDMAIYVTERQEWMTGCGLKW